MEGWNLKTGHYAKVGVDRHLELSGGREGFHCRRQEVTVYSPILSQVPEAEVEFFTFDKAYLDRLRGGDPATELHFVSYFEQLLRIKLRSKRLASDVVEDLQQKTFVRVIERVRRNEVRQPERFGAFVNSTCNHVLFEHYRDVRKNLQMDEGHLEMPDKVLDLEGMLVSKQCAQRVREVLEEMPQRDRDILRAIFLEEKDKDTVCGEFGVDRNYLRVLLHRAKDKFRAFYEKEQIGTARRARGLVS